MADVRPFRGIRYNEEAIGDLSLVVAPPYDVISDEGRDFYYNRHPYNVIRLILNRAKKSDPDDRQPYRRAAEFIQRWRAQRILIQDPAPSLYLYRQRYLLEGEYRECTGVVARVRVVDFAQGVVLPHEEIMPRPLEDRTLLLEHTGMNLSMVQAVYSDPAEKLKAPLIREMERFPLAQFQTADGVAHDLWGAADEKLIDRVGGFLSNRPLYIADGHHRYQTALEYRNRLQDEGRLNGEDDPRNFLMMLIVEMENPGLSVLPVHRVIMNGDRAVPPDLMERLSEWFNCAAVEVPAGSRSGQVYYLLNQLEARGSSGTVFGAFVPGEDRFYVLSLKSDLDPAGIIEGDYSEAYKDLDVTVLHQLIIERTLGISPERESVEENLSFTRDPMDAMRLAESGRGSIVFFVNPTRVEQVKAVADEGEKMPQKSTYFYPKPCSGAVMNAIEEW